MNQPRICRQCGAQIDTGAKFCPYCGFNYTSAVQTQQDQNNGTRPQAGGQGSPGQQQRQNMPPQPGGQPGYNGGVPQAGPNIQSPPGQQQRQNIQPPPGGHPGFNGGVPQAGPNMQNPPGQQQRQNMQPPPGGHPGYNGGVPQAGPNMQSPPGQQQRQNMQPPPGGYPGYNGGVPQAGPNMQGPTGQQQRQNMQPPPGGQQGYQNGGRGNMPPAYPQQQSRKSPVGIIIVLILVLIAGGAFAYKTLAPGKNGPDGAGGNTPLASNQSGSQKGAAQNDLIKPDLDPGQNLPAGAGGNTLPASTQQDSVKGVAQNDLSKPETYMPKPNQKTIYYEIYPDGEEGAIDVITANILPNALYSQVNIFTDEFGVEYGGANHYFRKSDGIYCIFDEEPYDSTKVLPEVIQQGASWVFSSEYGNIVYTIKQLGATCTLDCGTFTDCMVIEYDNQACGIKSLVYWAPGMGVILEQSVPDGVHFTELISYQKIDAAEAQSLVLDYCYYHEQINSQIGGQ